MTLDKAKRILPSFVQQLGEGVTDLAILRQRIEAEATRLTMDMLDAITAAKGSFKASEANAIDRKVEQLNRFLETTQ